jgi:hypothetical protein
MPFGLGYGVALNIRPARFSLTADFIAMVFRASFFGDTIAI